MAIWRAEEQTQADDMGSLRPRDGTGDGRPDGLSSGQMVGSPGSLLTRQVVKQGLIQLPQPSRPVDALPTFGYTPLGGNKGASSMPGDYPGAIRRGERKRGTPE